MAEQEHHHHFIQPADGERWVCATCQYSPDPTEDAVAILMAQQAGWIGTNVRNTFQWDMWLEDARAVIALLNNGEPQQAEAEARALAYADSIDHPDHFNNEEHVETCAKCTIGWGRANWPCVYRRHAEGIRAAINPETPPAT